LLCVSIESFKNINKNKQIVQVFKVEEGEGSFELLNF
jgi:hypothetical protein